MMTMFHPSQGSFAMGDYASILVGHDGQPNFGYERLSVEIFRREAFFI
jgi:hypothetical protein